MLKTAEVRVRRRLIPILTVLSIASIPLFPLSTKADTIALIMMGALTAWVVVDGYVNSRIILSNSGDCLALRTREGMVFINKDQCSSIEIVRRDRGAYFFKLKTVDSSYDSAPLSWIAGFREHEEFEKAILGFCETEGIAISSRG